jgi:hypothetical protein
VNVFSRPLRRDTPEEIDLLHNAGYRRSIEIDGIGLWEHEAWPHDSWTGPQRRSDTPTPTSPIGWRRPAGSRGHWVEHESGDST